MFYLFRCRRRWPYGCCRQPLLLCFYSLVIHVSGHSTIGITNKLKALDYCVFCHTTINATQLLQWLMVVCGGDFCSGSCWWFMVTKSLQLLLQRPGRLALNLDEIAPFTDRLVGDTGPVRLVSGIEDIKEIAGRVKVRLHQVDQKDEPPVFRLCGTYCFNRKK